MPLPWAYGPKQFAITLGENAVIRMDVPDRGRLLQLMVQQVGGASDGTFRLYDSEEAALAQLTDPGSASLSEELVGGQWEPHQVMAERTITDGAYAGYGLDVPYRNRDHTDREPARHLWMLLNCSGVGEGTFVLSALIEPGAY